MIEIQIGDSTWMNLGDIDEPWINKQINARRRDGESVCVKVKIQCKDVDIILATPTCGGRGGGKQLTAAETQLVELWRDRGLSDTAFASGNVIAFLKQAERQC